MNRLMLSCLALFVALSLAASPAHATCSNATMTGVWGYFVGSSIGQFTADGLGNITNGTQTTSSAGVISTQSFTGTYSIGTKCTGSVTLTYSNGGGTITANIVLNNGNKSAQIIGTQAGKVSSGFAAAQGTVTCGLTGVKKTLAANIFGKFWSSGASVAYVAQIILNGKGTVSGSGTFDNNGTFTFPATIPGTYTETSTCTGTITMTPAGYSTLNFNFVVVNSGKELLVFETDNNTDIGGTLQQ
ncbi:MAG TPA: hypothetical protein VGS27_34135 [Candidatus Sulfotelmatobacter sp.]|nr:hypothetical protein [Candidatus Sulfotelmatobacter sp.]